MRSKPNKKLMICLIFLALVCVIAVELIACRHFNRPLYDELTAPVVRAAETVKDTAVDIADRAIALFNRAKDKVIYHLRKNEPEVFELHAPIASEAPDPESLAYEDGQVVSAPLIVDTEPVTDPAITELQETENGDILTGGPVKIVYYNQRDDEWKDQLYGSDPIGSYGCGPTAMAMAVASLTDTETDPAAMAAWAAKNGYWAYRSGSYLSIIDGTAEAYGLDCQPLAEKSSGAVRDALIAGKLIVALMGPGHFTTGGHFIILRGMTLTGEVLVADPASLDRSLTTWEPQLIIDELSKSTSSGAPIWVISLPDSSDAETP